MTGSERNWERADVNLAVVCRSREDVLDDIARKLGAGGMFVESDAPRPVGSVVEVEKALRRQMVEIVQSVNALTPAAS